MQAGDGGAGCNSFKGIKFTRSRHPDGGSGGRGADVIIKADRNVRTLEHLQFRQHARAENGKTGRTNRKKGADGRPCIIRVALGTLVRDLKNDLLLGDLIATDQELVVAKGGEGGKGNTGTKAATAGFPGEKRDLFLELKLVAEVAIIGYPNAGKSALLAQITSARPKIAVYPFTTTSPFLGVLEFPDFEQPASLTMVELPGLIQGSHQGRGLGGQFLRHAQRARVLVLLIDISAQQGQDPFEVYNNLRQELKLYNPQLSQKTQILVANKMDAPQAKSNLTKFAAQVNQKIYPISAITGSGIKELLDCLRSHF